MLHKFSFTFVRYEDLSTNMIQFSQDSDIGDIVIFGYIC